MIPHSIYFLINKRAQKEVNVNKFSASINLKENKIKDKT